MSNPQQKGTRKPGLNSVISWGASIVIIGLMFKILHWQGGEYMIGLGLATESFLFGLLGFSAMEVVGAKGADGKVEKASDINDLLSTAITPKVINELSAGFAQFNKTVAAVSQVAGSFDSTKNLIKEFDTATADLKKFRENMAMVGTGFDQFNKSLQAVSQMSASSQGMMKDFEAASAGMKSFSKNVTDMNAGIDTFNKTLGSINQMTASSATMMKEFEAATANMRAYNKNLADLAKIYQAQLDAFRKN